MKLVTSGNNVKASRTRLPSLKRNFSWSFFGNVVYAVTQWGSLMVLVRLGTPDMVGQYTLALALSGPVFMFTNMQLASVIATDAKRANGFGEYLGLRLLTAVLALAVVSTIVFFTERRWDTRWLVVVISVSKMFESMSDVSYGLFQQRERMDLVSISLVSRGLVGLLLFSALMMATGSLIVAGAGVAASWAVVFAWHDIPRAAKLLTRLPGIARHALRPVFSVRTMAKISSLALPLGFVGVLDSLVTNIPRYYIRHHHGEAALGHFSALAYVIVAGGTLIGAVASSVRPRLAQYYADDLGRYRKLTARLCLLGLGLGLAGVFAALVAGKHVLTLLYRTEYAQFNSAFVWLMVAAGLWYLAGFIGTAVTAAHYFKSQTPLFALTALATALGSVIWVPSFGVLGGAWALCLGMLVRFLGSGLIYAHALRAKQ